MAQRLYDGVRDIPGVQLDRPVQANSVFPRLPKAAIPTLQEEMFFYVWDEAAGEVRWVCSWDTTEADIDGFADAVRRVLAGT